MLNIVVSAIMSFNLIGNSFNVVKPYDYQPPVNVEMGTFEVESWREGLIGRHQMVSYDSLQYLGPLEVKRLSKTYNAAVLDNFHFTETVTTTQEDTISLSISASSKFISTLGVKAGLKGIEVNSGYTVEDLYTIEGKQTYTIANITTTTLEFDVDQSKVEGKKFHLAEAAYVYKINCQKWQYDDYWWGDYEVDGTRSSFSAYLTIDPYVTIALEGGILL